MTEIETDEDPMERKQIMDEKTERSVEQAQDVEAKAEYDGSVTTNEFSVEDALANMGDT